MYVLFVTSNVTIFCRLVNDFVTLIARRVAKQDTGRRKAYCTSSTHLFSAGYRGTVWRLNIYVQCGRILCEFEIVV